MSLSCDSCDRPFKDGDEVEASQFGEIVDGKFQPTEEERLVHAEGSCLEDD